MTNTKLLEELIEKSGLKKSYIAEKLGLSRTGFYKKVKNQSEFSQSEIDKLCNILNIVGMKNKEDIFFASK